MLFTIEYWNDGGAPAENTVISETLHGMTYLRDTSGFPRSGSATAADPIVWQLGALPTDGYGSFEVYVQVTASASETVTSTTRIAMSNPYDGGSASEKESAWSDHVAPNDTHLRVTKWPWTHDPAAGSDFVWTTDVCNDGGTNSAEVLLTDTLPLSTTLVNWWSGFYTWTEVLRNDDQLVLSRPSIRSDRCQQVYVRTHVDDHAWTGMVVTNTVHLSASNDLESHDNTAPTARVSVIHAPTCLSTRPPSEANWCRAGCSITVLTTVTRATYLWTTS
jgi:uncharacterized repeat protein (TIGR01451 family)